VRNYDQELVDNEGRKYFYGFDYDIMHPLMIKSFSPFFRGNSLLELGSHYGRFTTLLEHKGRHVTCIEASSEAVKIAKKIVADGTVILNSRFEDVELSQKFSNVVMTHTLEHLDDPVSILKRVNDEWLEDDGLLLLVCPNANAPSRQIAVNMGLITHNAAVTPAEKEHGHHITYSLDTLERDAVAAGLEVIHRSGIFFKALANFQWDLILKTDIVSKEYLEGCYELGQRYPDLCSSIFLVCKKGED
jgi:2-polyprenyl-3-methyl-5-hydroxy-6-metoxy-1,4-benzoquinol methylase